MHAKTASRSANASAPKQRGHAHWEQGLALAKRAEWAQAAKAFAKACELTPQDTLYRMNWARALLRAGQVDDALAQTQKIIAMEPRNLLAYHLQGECLVRHGRHAQAAEVMLEGLKYASPSAEYLQVLGNVLFSAQRYQEGIKILMDALSMEVDHALSHYRMGLCFNALGMRAEAVECLTTAQVLGLGNGELACNSLLAFIRRELCEWEQAEPNIEAMNRLIDQLQPDSVCWSSVFASVTLTGDPQRHLKAARACANFYGHGIQPLPAAPRQPGSKIRLGFVSADFHQHATCILMAELIEQIDRSAFEVILYSHGPDDGSPMRQRVREAADRFVVINTMGDRQAAEMIRADGIDVLVDLKGHTINCRLGIFAYRPAPIQVTYLGFPGTSGAPYIDYFLGDGVASPLAEAANYSEKLALMPVCYQPNDRQRALPAPTTRAEHGLPEDALVLCGFNQPFKISAEVLDVWCELLHRHGNAVLWLLAWNDQAPDKLRAEAARRGIDPQRLVFATKMPSAQHLSRFALADIYLDIWPCNGHTTVSDALWAGVPVVTLRGHSFASRVATSLLHAVGLDEGSADTVEGYMQLVDQLASNPALRQQWREHLAKARDEAPLFDTQLYARDFGRLMTAMVARHDQGLAPDHVVLNAD